MNAKFDLITIGDSTMDTFIKIHDASVECDINHEECKICLRYGSKIPVDAIAQTVAGNAANVALGCSSLGLRCAIYTNLGGDEHGTRILKTFEEKGIGTGYVKVEKDKSSNLSVVLTFEGERTIFVYHQPWYYQLPDLAPCGWVYFTSLAETFTDSNIVDEVCHFIDKSRANLVFSPGTFQLKANIKRYPRLLERTKLLIINLEEAKTILEIEQVEKVDSRELMSKILLMGPKIVVVTDGEEGSYATDGQKNYKAGIFPTKVYEKTGAGEAYASGLLAALFYGKDLAEAMIWGTINASHVISHIGPNRGLMSKEELERYRAAVPEFEASPF